MKCPTCGQSYRRSNEQNRRYWAILNEISDQFKPSGATYSPETWHKYFKIRFLGADDIKLPNGKVITEPKSSASLHVDEMNDYMTKIEVFAAEHGVIINEL